MDITKLIEEQKLRESPALKSDLEYKQLLDEDLRQLREFKTPGESITWPEGVRKRWYN